MSTVSFESNYIFLQPLKETGYWRVSRGWDTISSTSVIIKATQTSSLAPALITLLKKEGAYLEALSQHPYFPKLHHSIAFHEMRWALVMEDCGENLYEIVAKKQKANQFLSLAEVTTIAAEVLKGLQVLENLQICHADLKPENITVKKEQVKIIDFGSVVRDNDPRKFPYQSAWYRAPEISLELSEEVQCKIDMWSFGCILYEMITTFPLFPVIGRESWFLNMSLMKLAVQISGPLPQEWIEKSWYSSFFSGKILIPEKPDSLYQQIFLGRQKFFEKGSLTTFMHQFCGNSYGEDLFLFADVIKKSLKYHDRIKPGEAIRQLLKLP